MSDDRELQAQLALVDARLDIANGKMVTKEQYRKLIESLTAGRESRAKAIAGASKARKPSAQASKVPLTEDALRDLFRASAELESSQ